MARYSNLRLPPHKLTLDLMGRWPRLNLVERGDELEKIVALGFSRRAIARGLGCSEGMVRRNLKLAKLPASARAAIAVGHSAKEVLSAKLRGEPLPLVDIAAAKRAYKERLLARCMDEAGPWLLRHLPWPGYKEQFLTEADRRLWCQRRCKTQIHPSSSRIEIRRHRPRRRAPGYGPDLLEHLLEWFLHWASEVLASPDLRDQLFVRLRKIAAGCRYEMLKNSYTSQG